MLSRSVKSNSLRAHGLYPTRFSCPRNFLGKNTRADFHFLRGAGAKYLLASAGNARDMGSIPRLERLLGVGNGNLLQYSCLWGHKELITTQHSTALQWIFLTQRLNLHFLHWQVDSLPLCHLGSPIHRFASANSTNWIKDIPKNSRKF